MFSTPLLRTRALPPLVLALAASGAIFGLPSHHASASGIEVVTSSFTATDGTKITATNHLVQADLPASTPAQGSHGHEYLLVWAGDSNVSDTTGATIKNLPITVNPVKVLNEDVADDGVAPDFLAVIDADKTSPDYGKVVNTITVGPLVENEPHHMQYLYHQGDNVFAGGLFTSATYVFNVKHLPLVSIVGSTLPTDTLCGSIPDAYWTLKDHTAYATYMGGPVAPGPCTDSTGKTILSNGYGGSPGEVVHLSADGKVLGQFTAGTGQDESYTVPATGATQPCFDLPQIVTATCANPHGIQAREDLHVLVTSDYAEPRNIILDPVKPTDAGIFRDTVRTWDITDENHPVLKSVAHMPDGPRNERNPGHEEPRGIMETTVTNLPGHKGAFASSMCGGVIYYTPDITAASPTWREVFDDTEASAAIQPTVTEGGGCDGGGWVQTSPDDKLLYHAVIGRGPNSLGADDTGSAKMVYTLDISKLTAAGTSTTCSITKISQVLDGGSQPECPTLVSALPINDTSSGGPHWGAPDNFVRQSDGSFAETDQWSRIAVSDYFVARTGVDGNHKVCMVDVSKSGSLSLDTSFRDEDEGTPCVSFDRTRWPHGNDGNAKPHSELFVVADDDIKPALTATSAAVAPSTRTIQTTALRHQGWSVSGSTLTARKATLSIPFTGTGESLALRSGPDGGRLQVLVDGRSRGTIDLWSSKPKSFLRSITGLSAGAHTLTLKALGTHRAASHGSAVRVGAVTVFA